VDERAHRGGGRRCSAQLRLGGRRELCRIKIARSRPRQLELPMPPTWGGRRAGAGRKPSGTRARPPHIPRPEHDRRHAVHVTLRAACPLVSLRSDEVFPHVRGALAASSRGAFSLLHFSVQSDHLHLIVEADSTQELSRGVQGLAVRCARAINRSIGRRGTVWSQRYHARPLGTPREVRAALVYVLLNFRKHLRAPPGIDPCSSGPWFDGWARPPPAPGQPCPVASPRTWLTSVGWRRTGGPIDCREAPAPPPGNLRPKRPGRQRCSRKPRE
jgi:hypothetical protein